MKKIYVFISLFLILILACSCTKDVNEQEEYKIMYNGVNVTPGNEFDSKKLKESAQVSEIPSCAFEGNDIIYTYPNLEITTAYIDNVETIYSVYFIDDSISTTEGVKITDSKEDVLKVYGNNYKENNNEIKYEKGKVTLKFLFNNGFVTNIEYALITE